MYIVNDQLDGSITIYQEKLIENKEHFGQLTDRMQAFREEVLDKERAMIVTKVYKEMKISQKCLCFYDRM